MGTGGQVVIGECLPWCGHAFFICGAGWPVYNPPFLSLSSPSYDIFFSFFCDLLRRSCCLATKRARHKSSLVLVVQKLGWNISRWSNSLPISFAGSRRSLVCASLVTSVASLLPHLESHFKFDTSGAANMPQSSFDNIMQETFYMVRTSTAAVVKSAGLTLLAAWYNNIIFVLDIIIPIVLLFFVSCNGNFQSFLTFLG